MPVRAVVAFSANVGLAIVRKGGGFDAGPAPIVERQPIRGLAAIR